MTLSVVQVFSGSAMTLTAKQCAFVEKYLTHWNATQAALMAGYTSRSAASIGSENLKKPEIQAAIRDRLADLHMSADEVLSRLTAIARTSLADIAEIDESGEWRIDLKKAQQTGAIHAIKKLRAGKYGPEIELHDSLSALDKLGKRYGLFIERHEHSGPDGAAIQIEDARDRLAERLARFAVPSDAPADPDSDSGSASGDGGGTAV